MAEFRRVGAQSDFAEGLVRVFEVDGIDVAVVRHAGEYFAFSGRCPHAGYAFNFTRVRPGDRILCSSHLAWFELRTGKVLDGPTDRDLEVYEVRVEGDDVLVRAERR
ncbi:MAG TPA: Rieske (2Fe-2S) protein [Dehalococcoidia bacterium]|nr:Rieske (2Fe-2S) protein [Dehalococcoidia bacterium]